MFLMDNNHMQRPLTELSLLHDVELRFKSFTFGNVGRHSCAVRTMGCAKIPYLGADGTGVPSLPNLRSLHDFLAADDVDAVGQ